MTTKELKVGVTIGATLKGTYAAAFSGARTTVLKLGQAADELRTRHGRLGDTMAQAMAHPGRNLGALHRQYERLGQAIDQLRLKEERLAGVMARGAALKADRAEKRGAAMETIGTAVALGAPVVQSVRLAAGFQDQLRDTAITGEFSKKEEAGLGSTVRKAALDWNQTQAEIARGVGVLVAGGIGEAKQLENYAPVMAKAATATRASMDDLGSVAIALKDNLNIGAEGFEGALNMLAFAGKKGQFELRDMAKWLPALSPSFQALGVTGKEAVAEIGAALQIARKGAGSNDEAANNFKNFLAKITSPDTLKDFEKAGIDLKTSMQLLRAKGMTPMQSMLEVITQYMTSKGPDAASKFKAAMAIKDDKERQAGLQKLTEAYKLGELFQDMQAMSFIRPALANAADMKDIRQGAMEAGDSASGKGLLDQDFAKRMETARARFDKFRIGMAELGLTIGDTLLPAVSGVIDAVMPGVKAFGDWAKEHPGLIKGVIGLVGGLLAAKLAFIGIGYGANLVLSPFVSLRTGISLLSAKWTLLQAMWQAGKFVPLLNGLRAMGSGVMAVGRILMTFGQGLLMTFGGPLMLAGRGLVSLGGVLASSFMPAVRLAGQAVLWLGRAMLMNPIGLAITAIALGAYLVYRNWGKLKPWFMGLWAEIRGAFAGGIGGVAKLVLDWSPVGLFYRAFAGVMKWLGVDMPARFTEFGANLVVGLVNGIKNKISAAGDAVGELAQGVKGWFANALGIKSPSRVFMGYGDNIGEGAALGIGQSAQGVAAAVAGMALATTAAWGQPQLQALPAPGAAVDMARQPRLQPDALPALPLLSQPVQRLLQPDAAVATPPPGAAMDLVQRVRPQLDALPALPPLSQPVQQLLQRDAVAQGAAVEQLTRAPLDDVGQARAELAQRVTRAQREVPAGATAPAQRDSGMVIHFSPQITVQGADGAAVKPQVEQAMQLSFQEFERMMRRYESDRRRRSYGSD